MKDENVYLLKLQPPSKRISLSHSCVIALQDPSLRYGVSLAYGCILHLTIHPPDIPSWAEITGAHDK